MTDKAKITTGKQLEAALIDKGENALWIKGRGLIVMTAYYGTDCMVQGTYDIYTMAQGIEFLNELDKPEFDPNMSCLAYYSHTGETRGKYIVR